NHRCRRSVVDVAAHARIASTNSVPQGAVSHTRTRQTGYIISTYSIEMTAWWNSHHQRGVLTAAGRTRSRLPTPAESSGPRASSAATSASVERYRPAGSLLRQVETIGSRGDAPLSPASESGTGSISRTRATVAVRVPA